MANQAFAKYFDGMTKDEIGLAFMLDSGVRGGFVATSDRDGLIRFIEAKFNQHGCWFAAMAANTKILPTTTVLFGNGEGAMEVPSVWAQAKEHLRNEWTLSCDI